MHAGRHVGIHAGTHILLVDMLAYVRTHTALNVSVVGLERALIQYCSQPNEQPFDIKTVPIETAPISDRPKCKCQHSRYMEW